jgi:hypothetical protein
MISRVRPNRGEGPAGFERRRSEVRRTDRRWLITLVFITAVSAGGGFVLQAEQHRLSSSQQHLQAVERESTRNCQLLDEAHEKFNALLDLSIQNTLKAQQLSESEKADRVKQYRDFHLPILHCPQV